MLVISSSQIGKYKNIVGAKTLNLKKLVDLGFSVLPFCAVPSKTLTEIFDSQGKANSQKLKHLSQELTKMLPCDFYAVRSSALIEDSKNSSFAGQFRTELNVRDLPKAIQNVVEHACRYLNGDLEKFSLVIQKYIDPDYSGVTFTRNPAATRDMLIEYHKGQGDLLASGQVKPEKLQFYWHEIPAYDIPDFDENVERFQQIEKDYGFPQDIEWCVKDGKWYFLQTRPITTFSENEYKGMLFLEEYLDQDTSFFYEKTEISEIVPRPTSFTMSLLEKIYSADGPVAKVYKKHGIHYEYQDFFRVIGNELYIDREQEIQTLFPGYTFLKNHKPQFGRIKGLLRTFKNICFLSMLSLKTWNILFKSLKDSLEFNKRRQNFVEALQQFLKDYELVFEINLLTSKAFKKLELVIKKEPVSFLEAFSESYKLFFDIEFPKIRFDSIGLQGNSLDIADKTKFVMEKHVPKTSKKIRKWLQNLPEWKKKYLGPIISLGIRYNHLREMGRWLTVKGVNDLRRILFPLAIKKGFREKKHIYFARLEEIEKESFDEQLCINRKKEYDALSVYTFPQKLCDSLDMVLKEKSVGVSSGKARGLLIQKEDVKKGSYDKILYTKMLTPDLVSYFDEVTGIVSETGGVLSHLAIMAREKGIPVIVNFSLRNFQLDLGDFVEINAGNGMIRKIHSRF